MLSNMKEQLKLWEKQALKKQVTEVDKESEDLSKLAKNMKKNKKLIF